MPGQMPEMLSKGKNLIALDKLLVTANQVAVQTLLKGVGDPNDLANEPTLRANFLALTVNQGVFTTADDDIGHFQRDWLDGGWWKNAHPIAPVLVRGFLKALDEGIKRNLNIETLWACTPPSDPGTDWDTGLVHVGVAPSSTVVMVVIHTPKLRAPTPIGNPQDLFVIRYEDDTKVKLVQKSPS